LGVVHHLVEQPSKGFYLVFGQLFNTAEKGLFNGTKGAVGSFSIGKFLNDQPDFNADLVFKYVPFIVQATVFKVKPGIH
jgi:hypothetical protein